MPRCGAYDLLLEVRPCSRQTRFVELTVPASPDSAFSKEVEHTPYQPLLARYSDIPLTIPSFTVAMALVIFPRSRVISHQLVARASTLGVDRKSCAYSLSRVLFKKNLSSLRHGNDSVLLLRKPEFRSYATKPGRPKAHTGRVTASKRKPAVARSDAKAGTPKKASTKEAAVPKKRAAPKPKRKSKAGVKAKPKAKPKRKALTEQQKAAKAKKLAGIKKKDLREQALLTAPKQLPSTAYTVLSTSSSSKGMRLAEHSKAMSAQYKSLSPEEMEVYSH